MTVRVALSTARHRSASDGRRMSWGQILLFVVLEFFVATGSASAQEMPPVRGGSAGSAGGAISEMGSGTRSSDDVRRPAPLEAPDVPVNVPVPFANSEPKPSDSEAPAYYISEVNLDGTVQGDRVDLAVRIVVEVNRANGWFDIPLRMGQASIYGMTSTGPGHRVPGDPALQDDGLHWKVHGQGRHTLQFDLGVPVRTLSGTRQLQLSLPSMPPLFEARVRLRIPGGTFNARSPDRNATLKATYDSVNRETLVEGGLPGGRLDLSWQEANSRATASGSVNAEYELRREGTFWELDVQQTVVLSESGTRELIVALPDGFRIVELSGLMVASWEPLAGEQQTVRVVLTESTRDRFDLKWRLRTAFNQAGENLQLAGLRLKGIADVEGNLRIWPVTGFQLLPADSGLQHAERVEDITQAGDVAAQYCFAFSSDTWKVQLRTQPVEPLFTCLPRVDVAIRENTATMTCLFELRQEAGEIFRFSADIGQVEKSGWVLSNASRLPGGGTLVREGEIVTMEWPPGQVSMRQPELRFDRALAANEFSFAVPIPAPRATWLETAIIGIRAADQLRVVVEGGTAVSDPRFEALSATDGTRIVGAYHPAAGNKELTVRGSVEALTKAATTNIIVESVDSRRITIEQMIVLDVRYGRLDALRLQIPEQFPVTPGAERKAFQIWVDGREAGDLEWSSGTLRVPFQRPRIGLIRVAVRYALPRSTGRDELIVPVVETPDVKYHEVTLEAPLSTRLRLSDDNALWQEIVTASDRRRWSADPSVTSAALALDRDRRGAGARASISCGFLTTEIAASGLQRTTAIYNIDRHSETLAIVLPPQSTLQRLMLDGEEVTDARAAELGNDTGNQWLLRIPDASRQGLRRLEVAYEFVSPRSKGGRPSTIVAYPVFPEEVYVEQVICRLILPESDVLTHSPEGATRLFEWKRNGFFWKRMLAPEYFQILTSNGFTEANDAAGREGLGYRILGAPSRLVIQSIDRSLVILLGAGISLILGFFFWTVRRLRNVITFLVLGFTLCLIGIWQAEAIQVLLQPALFGAALAATATAVDGRSRRRRVRVPARESSIHPGSRPPIMKASDPLRSTILRPTGSDHGAAR